GVAGAAQERAALAHALDHRLLALGALELGRLGRLARRAVVAAPLDVLALGVARAAEELALLAEALDQRLLALRALFGVGQHLGLGHLERLGERRVELLEYVVAPV